MASGVVKALVADRGFGFIKPDEPGRDIFFHAPSLVSAGWEEIAVGDRVIFEDEAGPDGRPRARFVEEADRGAARAGGASAGGGQGYD